MSRATLLVVAGEGSGDALAGPVVRELGVPAFGLGGAHLSRAGAELVADLAPIAAMGFGAVLRRAPALARAVVQVALAARARRPRAALLVGFSELNARLSPWLRSRGIRTLWYAPPQVWAWRRHRAPALARSADRLAVVLPFEQAVWREAGARVDYVGHPALGRAALAADPGVAGAGRPRLALLPGSRAHEIRAHLPRMLLAARALPVDAFVVRAPALDANAASWLCSAATAAGVPIVDAPLDAALAGARVALAGSGTATLECAALGVPPIIVYRTDEVTYAIAKRLVRVAHVGLPNLVLGRDAFPELLQSAATAENMAAAVSDVLRDHPRYLAASHAVRLALAANLDGRAPEERVAALLAPWLA